MTDEYRRIAIAKACGWTHCRVYNAISNVDVWGGHQSGTPAHYWAELPDYLNDLNAMREAEAFLTVAQCYTMNQHLCDMMGEWNPTKGATNWLWHATAAQRAEALLRTLGL